MKKLIRNATVLIVGALLAAAPAAATTWNVDAHAYYWGGAHEERNVSVPSGANVSWYAYVYGGSGYASANVNGPGVSLYGIAYDGQSDGGSGQTNAAGTVNVVLDTVANGGNTGCGVTIAW
jgi:hypothetical protein